MHARVLVVVVAAKSCPHVSRMQKAIENQCGYFTCLLCFGFKKRRSLLQECLSENDSDSLGTPVGESLQEST